MFMPDTYITVPAEQGTVHIAENVIAEIVGNAIRETEGVAGLTNAVGADFSDHLVQKSTTRGIGVAYEDGIVWVEASIFARYGDSIATVGERAQKAVTAAVDSMTGLPCRVNIFVAGVAFER